MNNKLKAVNTLAIIGLVIQLVLWFLGKPVPLLPDLGQPPIQIYLGPTNDTNNPAQNLPDPCEVARLWNALPQQLRGATVPPGKQPPGMPVAIPYARCYSR